MKNLIVIFILLVNVSLVNAQNIEEKRYFNVLKQLNLKKAKINEKLCAEKKMPNADDAFILVIPVLEGKVEEDAFSIKNIILITDEKGAIKNKYSDPEGYFSDAIMLERFTIDTGLYNLNSNVRAFGVIADYAGSSRPNPFAASEISMYYPEGKTLKKVLNQFQISKFGGEWDTNCEGVFEESSSVIIVEKAKTNDFFSLKIKTESSVLVTKFVDDDCTETKKTKSAVKILKFNKLTYQ